MSQRDSIEAACRDSLGAGKSMAVIGAEAGLGKTFLVQSAFEAKPATLNGTFSSTLTLAFGGLARSFGLPEAESVDIKEAVQATRQAIESGAVSLPGGGLFFDDVRDPEALLPYMIPGVSSLVTSPSAVFSGVMPESVLPPMSDVEGRTYWGQRHGDVPPPEWLHSLGGLPLAIDVAGPLLEGGHFDEGALQGAIDREMENEPGPGGEAPKGAGPMGDMEAWLEHQMAMAMQRRGRGQEPEKPSPALRALIGLPVSALGYEDRLHLGIRSFYGPMALPEGLFRGGDLGAASLRHLGAPRLARGWGGGPLHGAIQGAILGYLHPEELEESLEQAATGWLARFEGLPEGDLRGRDGMIPHLLHLLARARGRGLFLGSALRAASVGAGWLARRGLLMEAQVQFEGTISGLKSNHIDVPWRGEIHRELAGIFRRLGQNDEALYQLEEAARHFEGRVGPGHPMISALNKERVALLKAQFEAVNQGLHDLGSP